MEIGINLDGSTVIDGVEIKEELFREEIVSWRVEDIDRFIDDLINWTAEATRDREMMKEDLRKLMATTDECMFSSIMANEYILKEWDEELFEKIGREIIEANNLLLKETNEKSSN